MEDKELIERLVETEQRSKSNTKRLDDVEAEVKENRELTVAVKEIATEMKHLREEQTDINKRLKVIEEKPSQNWDKIVTTIIGTIVGAIVGGIIGLIIK